MSIFNNKKIKQENIELQQANYNLQQQVLYLQQQLSIAQSTLNNSALKDPYQKQQYLANLNSEITNKQNMISNQQNVLNQTQSQINALNTNIKELNNQITLKNKQLIDIDEEISIQEFGLYRPHFLFAHSSLYKDRLNNIRTQQKEMIKNEKAIDSCSDWTVNNSKEQGKKMIKDMTKLLLRAFNNECDDIISKVKYTNYDSSLNRIQKSAATISKLGTIMNISITNEYIALKIEELKLAFEFAQLKQQEKETAKEEKAKLKEQEKLQKELDAQKAKLDKEQTHYTTAYSKILNQMLKDPNNENLIEKKEEIETHLASIEKAQEDIDYRQINQKAGYVYIISNIGAFGENIYKIGMTRRLDPQDRIDELGNASVPFNFDIHATIFSDDAPALEAALHKAFENKKVNMVNKRKEFFNVTLDEIKKVVSENFDKTVEYIDIPDAEQYRISQKIKQELYNSNTSNFSL